MSNLEFTTFLDDFKYPEEVNSKLLWLLKTHFTSVASPPGWHPIGTHSVFIANDECIVLGLFQAGTKERSGSQSGKEFLQRLDQRNSEGWSRHDWCCSNVSRGASALIHRSRGKLPHDHGISRGLFFPFSRSSTYFAAVIWEIEVVFHPGERGRNWACSVSAQQNS